MKSVSAWTQGKGVAVILDPVGGNHFNDNLEVLAVDGALVLIGLMGGHRIESSLVPMLGKRLRVIGSTLRNRSLKYKSALICELEREIWPSFATGELVVEVDAVYPIKRVQEAHNHMRADANFGKILLTVGARHASPASGDA